MTLNSPAADLHHAWKAALKSPKICRQGGQAGVWLDPSVELAELAEAIVRLETAPGRLLKSSGVSRVVRGSLLGQPVILKRHFATRGWKQVTNRFRPSRARRCWATSTTLREGGIACSPAIGFFEEAGQSVVLFAQEPDAVPARRWIKAWLHQREAGDRVRFTEDLADAFMDLYRHRVYHADTKTSNMLVRHPDDPAQRTFLWIDLACVRFGVTPTRRRVLRNLVQLNGSVGSKLSEADRRAFLVSLSGRFPWVLAPEVCDRIRDRTMTRLQRELSGTCGP